MASDNETLEEKQPQLPAQEVKVGEEHEDVEVKEKAEEDEGVGNEETEEKGSGNDEEEEKGSDNIEVKDEKERMEVDNKSEEKEKLKGEKKGSTRKRKKRKREKEKASPVTPAIDRPTRKRKIVERYTETSAARSTTPKPFSIEKDRGTALKDIPNVAFMLSKRKPDDIMQMLHHILFGRKTKAQMLKRNIGMFSGFAWAESEEEKQRGKLKEKLDKCVKEKLFYFCEVLNIPIHRGITRKEELSAKLLEFLKSPHATTDTLLADKEKKGKKQKEKASASKTAGSSNTASGKSAKNAYHSFVEERFDQNWIEATYDSNASTHNLLHSEDEAFSQAASGVYKGRVDGMENEPSIRRSTYSELSSMFMLRVQYDEMQLRLTELTELLNIERQQHMMHLQRTMNMVQVLQSKMEKLKKYLKKKKKHRIN